MKAQKQGVFLSDDRYGVPAWSSDAEEMLNSLFLCFPDSWTEEDAVEAQSLMVEAITIQGLSPRLYSGLGLYSNEPSMAFLPVSQLPYLLEALRDRSDPESETLLIALEGLNKPNPMDLQLEEFVLDNDNLLVAYLTAPWGSRLGIYQKHNRLDWECSQDVGNEIADEDQPICWIKCPGLHNLSMDLFYDPTIEQPPAQWSRERIINHAVAVGGDFSDLFRQILSELQEAYQVCNP